MALFDIIHALLLALSIVSADGGTVASVDLAVHDDSSRTVTMAYSAPQCVTVARCTVTVHVDAEDGVWRVTVAR